MTAGSMTPEPQATGFGIAGDPDCESLVDGKALADLATAPVDAIAERAAKALSPVLPHAALLVVITGCPVPVQITAPDDLRELLAGTDWTLLHKRQQPLTGPVARMELPGVVAGLRLAGWIAASGGITVALVLGHRSGFHLTPGQERAAMRVAMQAAARAAALDADPPPGALAFSRAMSHERERIRLELSSRYATDLSRLLHTLRNAAEAGGVRTPGVAKAIDLASQALLDMQEQLSARNLADAVPIAAAFAEIGEEATATLQAAGIRLIARLEAAEGALLPSSVAHAARLVTRAAVLSGIEDTGAEKFRLLWRMTDDCLVVVTADNNAGSGLAADRVLRRFGEIRRWVSELGGEVMWDVTPGWGAALRCSLPLHRPVAMPETQATRRLAELGDREQEVLQLMVAGLRNRGIAERLYISERTVKFHVSNILAKLGVQSRTEAIALAHNAGVSPPR
jgi:DNA-binding CsgD family transcriptional regulator